MDMTQMTASELMLWDTANLWKEGKEGAYAIWHGGQPVRDFGRPREAHADDDKSNYFKKVFPYLFPYGEGGIEGQQEVTIHFSDHVKWALRYHDRCFRKHETFPFVAFGIQQRRQMLLSARLQMRRRVFEKSAHLLSTIMVEKPKQAQVEEKNGRPISDPAVQLLRQHIFATGGRVTGSDQARYQLRSQI